MEYQNRCIAPLHKGFNALTSVYFNLGKLNILKGEKLKMNSQKDLQGSNCKESAYSGENLIEPESQDSSERKTHPLKYPPISEKAPFFLHGADYNPDQWLHMPEILEEDYRLMKLAKCNVMSVGIFAWASIEKEEGKFDFYWLDRTMDNLYKNGVYVMLATPSAARPAWLSQKYPEVLRVRENRVRNLHGGRHNHCLTSPIYREKVQIINAKLAERYKDHPALIAWHVSNEYGGQCHCQLCQEEFRQWLKKKYDGDLERLNQAWWTPFWSHTYTDWSQIESPAPHGERTIMGLNLDWKRFTTDQTIDFFLNEIKPLREITPNIPVTTNFDDFVDIENGINYWKFAPHVDFVSWDNYPYWHGERPDPIEGSRRAFIHDINRSLKHGQPFAMMESSPSATNWQPVGKLRRPGMHVLSSLQAVAHGSETVQYFQWRKSRGGYEKFHGAVVDHCGHENTRVFKEVSQVGEMLSKLTPILGTSVSPEVAVIYDWENSWAISGAIGPRRDKKDYFDTCQSHYRTFWEKGIPTDVIDMDCDFSNYKVLVAPMLYMVRPGVAGRIEDFVRQGGTFVTTYLSGIADENDLCFLGGFPGPLRELTGIWSEEIDALYDHDVNYVYFSEDLAKNGPLKSKEYEARTFCDLFHCETAKPLGFYKEDFYAGRPAVTVNKFGKGNTYYIGFRNNDDFLTDFYETLINSLYAQGTVLRRAIAADLPYGVTAQLRTDGEKDFVFLSNFTCSTQTVKLDDNEYTDLITGRKVDRIIDLQPYNIIIMERRSLNSNTK